MPVEDLLDGPRAVVLRGDVTLDHLHRQTLLARTLERGLRDRAGESVSQFNVLRVVAGREGGSAHAVDLIRAGDARVAGAPGDPEVRTEFHGRLRQVRLALRHGVTAQEWDDCIGP